MGNALSMDLRVRFKRLMDGCMRAAEAGRVLLLGPATAARWGNKIRDGASLDPLRSGPRKGSDNLAPFLDFFVELIEQDPDITLVELQSSLLVAHASQTARISVRRGRPTLDLGGMNGATSAHSSSCFRLHGDHRVGHNRRE